MLPVKFPEQTRTLAEHQKEYLPLPVYHAADGTIVSCWRLSIWERLKLLVTGRIWVLQLTFHQPLQPQALQVRSPFKIVSPKPKLENVA